MALSLNCSIQLTSIMIAALTQRQRYWLEHVQACEASGKSMVEYAESQDIAVRAMYSGRKTLIKKGILPTAQPARFQTGAGEGSSRQ